jgi:2-amino-4-hydroxy-6-hydroxymethyldihydropteridine diphosphokinase
MKRKLNNSLNLHKTHLYPIKSLKFLHNSNNVVLGIGGNIGNVKQIFHKLFLALKCDARFHILQTSPLLKNPPFGYTNQDDFLNGIIVVQTKLSPKELLKQINRYEKRFGRVRTFQDAPRTLDIDIIFYDDKKINTKDLIIPHKDWYKRDSVTIPLEYIDA